MCGWLEVCSLPSMRFLIGFLIVAAIAVGIVKHTRHEEPAPSALVAKPQTAARTTSEHNWPKSSLDRVAEVKHQVAQQRKEDGY